MDPRDVRGWLLLIVCSSLVAGVVIHVGAGGMGLVLGILIVAATVGLRSVLLAKRHRSRQ